MSLPKLMSPSEVAAYLECSEDTLARWRCNFDGPAWVKVGGRVAYPENAIVDYLNSQLNGTTEQKMRLAITADNAAIAAARAERLKAMQDLDAADREGNGVVDPYAVTVTNAGQPAGAKMEQHWNVPAQTFDNRPVTVAVAPVQHGRVPVPK